MSGAVPTLVELGLSKHMNGGFGEDGVEESVSVVRGAAE